MMNKKAIMLIIIGIIIIMNYLMITSALGVSPGRTTMNYDEGDREVPITIVNSEHKEMTVVIYTRGELGPYITLETQTTTLKADEETKTIQYKTRLPKELSPGRHVGEIVIMEIPKESIKTEDGKEIIILDQQAVSATVAVVSQLQVYVISPGKYLEATIDIVTEGAGEGIARIIIPVTNQGKLGIGSAKATVDIYTALNEKVATLTTNEQSLESLERKEIFAEWNYKSEGMLPGKYRAVATINYDGETAYADKNFDIGSRNLDIESIIISNFKIGEIAKFNILVNNNWNEQISDVNVQIEVYNDAGQVMADFKSANYELKELAKTTIVSYWDTTGVEVGTYEGKLTLKYGDRISERPIKVTVKNNGIEVEGFTGTAIFPKAKLLSTTNILIGVVLLLVIINGIWFYLFLKKKKRMN